MLLDIISRPDYLDVIELLKDDTDREAARVSIRDGNLSQFLDYVDEWKLHFGILPSTPERRNIFGAHSDVDMHQDEYEVYLAKNVFEVRNVIATVEDHDDVNMGLVFGYPKCCVDTFYDTCLGANYDSQSDVYPHLSNAIIKSKLTPRQSHFLKIMSPTLENRVIGFFPCSFDCTEAIKHAERRARHIKEYYNWEPQPSMIADGKWKIHFDA